MPKVNELSQQLSELLEKVQIQINEHEEKVESFDREMKEKLAAVSLQGHQILTAAKESADRMMQDAEKLVSEKEAEVRKLEAVKNRIVQMQSTEDLIMLDVGGVRFTTTQATLTSLPESFLGVMFSGNFKLEKGKVHFIDRDGTHFRYILNFLRDRENFICSLSAQNLIELKMEACYYSLYDAMFIQAEFSMDQNAGDSTWGPFPLRCIQEKDGQWYLENECDDEYLSAGKSLAYGCGRCNTIFIDPRKGNSFQYSKGTGCCGILDFFNNDDRVISSSLTAANNSSFCPVCKQNVRLPRVPMPMHVPMPPVPMSVPMPVPMHEYPWYGNM